MQNFANFGSNLLNACKSPGGGLQVESTYTGISLGLLQSWQEVEAEGEVEEAAEDEEEGDPTLRVKAAMNRERNSKSDLKWVCLH